MGLGKTIQAIAIAAAYLKDHLVDGGPPTLVVVPAVVRAMWVNELEKWLDGRVQCIAVAEPGKAKVEVEVTRRSHALIIYLLQ